MPLEPKKLSKIFDILKNSLIFVAPFKHCFEQSMEGKKAPLGAEKFVGKALGLISCCRKICRFIDNKRGVKSRAARSVGLIEFLKFITVTANTIDSGKLPSFALF